MATKLNLPEQEIIDAYVSGESTVTLAKRYSTYPSYIHRMLKLHGVVCRNHSEAALLFAEKNPRVIRDPLKKRWQPSVKKANTKKLIDIGKYFSDEENLQTKSYYPDYDQEDAAIIDSFRHHSDY